ncbi:uncharacterized protein LOC142228865 [Haematobia irritans]|uniref:uncharacterized protein LOC142228865 n=1 Tax=Haematobia irritans TaxID=7368 RepID=UPI003F4FAFB4
MDIFCGDIFCWSDSTIVLSWIRDHSSNYQTFISNRISRIQSLTNSMQWKYVPMGQNPADLISRGTTAQNLATSRLWLNGPEFLIHPSNYWPEQPPALTNLPEKRKHALIATSTKISDLSLNCKFISSFGKVARVFAYISKFGNHNTKYRKGPLTTVDVKRGKELLIRMIQKSSFPVEYDTIIKNLQINSSSPLSSLNPFIDKFGLLRVGGRLENSLLSFESQHPIILKATH